VWEPINLPDLGQDPVHFLGVQEFKHLNLRGLTPRIESKTIFHVIWGVYQDPFHTSCSHWHLQAQLPPALWDTGSDRGAVA